jgi:hypothetical protein
MKFGASSESQSLNDRRSEAIIGAAAKTMNAINHGEMKR